MSLALLLAAGQLAMPVLARQRMVTDEGEPVSDSDDEAVSDGPMCEVGSGVTEGSGSHLGVFQGA